MPTKTRRTVTHEYRIVHGATGSFGSATPDAAAVTAREQAIFNMRPFVLDGWEAISIGGGGVQAPEKEGMQPTGAVCVFVLLRRKLPKPLPAKGGSTDPFTAP